jgi:hypothetical protein
VQFVDLSAPIRPETAEIPAPFRTEIESADHSGAAGKDTRAFRRRSLLLRDTATCAGPLKRTSLQGKYDSDAPCAERHAWTLVAPCGVRETGVNSCRAGGHRPLGPWCSIRAIPQRT